MQTPTTKLSLVKPDDSDIIKISDINGNMDKIDAWAASGNVNGVITPILSSALVVQYPAGWSMFKLTSSDITFDSGWAVDPGTTTGTVVTFVPTQSGTPDRGVQLWYRGTITPGNGAAYYRYMTSTTLGPWMRFAGADLIGTSATANATVANNTWVKVSTTSNTDFSSGADCTVSAGGIKLNGSVNSSVGSPLPAVYRCEAMVQWPTGGGNGPRLLGIDDWSLAGPSNTCRDSVIAPAGEAIAQTVTITKSFLPNTVIGIWANQSGGSPLVITDRRLVVVKLTN